MLLNILSNSVDSSLLSFHSLVHFLFYLPHFLSSLFFVIMSEAKDPRILRPNLPFVIFTQRNLPLNFVAVCMDSSLRSFHSLVQNDKKRFCHPSFLSSCFFCHPERSEGSMSVDTATAIREFKGAHFFEVIRGRF